MNVLSLFDGISCGQLALERANISVDNYYASEIDKYAIAVAKQNYLNTIHLGDVLKWKEWDINWSSIDLLIGGSPCQGFSIAGKRLNFDDPRSKLFFVYIDILNHIQSVNPNVKFLLENVKMKKEWKDIITSYIKVKPIEINSALVSAQNRKRLYWTNINGGKIEQPEDKNIYLKDILLENAFSDRNKSLCLTATYGKGTSLKKYIKKSSRQLIFEEIQKHKVNYKKTLIFLEKETKRGKIEYLKTDSQGNRIYSIHDKSVTLSANGGGRGARTGLYAFGCITPDIINKKQNGQKVNTGEKFYTLTTQDGHGVLTEGYVRKLTPLECEILQTIPIEYTKFGLFGETVKEISNNQRYKMLGNGWTIDVIVHIFSKLHK